MHESYLLWGIGKEKGRGERITGVERGVADSSAGVANLLGEKYVHI